MTLCLTGHASLCVGLPSTSGTLTRLLVNASTLARIPDSSYSTSSSDVRNPRHTRRYFVQRNLAIVDHVGGTETWKDGESARGSVRSPTAGPEGIAKEGGEMVQLARLTPDRGRARTDGIAERRHVNRPEAHR